MIKQLTIDESKWVRGNVGGESALLNEAGNMCCLGFLSKSCGVPTEALAGTAMPDNLSPNHRSQLPAQLFDTDPRFQAGSDWTTEAADINDDDQLRLSSRRQRLVKHFEKIGIKLKFKPGKRPKAK